MNLHKCLLTNNDCYLRGLTITPKGVMVHSTGANNPKLSRYVAPDDGLLGTPSSNHWNKSGTGACPHAFISRLADGVMICHQEGYKRGIASNHADVLHWFPRFGKTMDDFRADVARVMRT